MVVMEKKEMTKLQINKDIVYPLILLLIPMIGVWRGVDVSDSTYSLGNYLFADRLSGMWVVSTFLSNVMGSLMVRLPGGQYLIGANIYSRLLLGMIALTVYLGFRRILKDEVVFIAEIVSICFCWIPTTILYNYWSYMMLCIGAVLVYRGVQKADSRLLILAGIMLGLNVFMRIPNLTNAALILVVWVGCYIYRRKGVVRQTFMCLAGYVTGLIIPVIMISIKYGFSSLGTMITGLVGITGTDDTYTMSSMIMDTLRAYGRSAKWVGIVVAGLVVCLIMFRIMPEKLTAIKKIVTLLSIAVIIRFFWGRGMFSFRYYEDYSSMYEWGMLALYMTIAAGIYVLVCKRFSEDIKLYAVLALTVIVISPLGSNNYTYQNLNNMFLVLPLLVYVVADMLKNLKETVHFPIKAYAVILLMMIIVQTWGFHAEFSFRDGMDGTRRDNAVWGVESLRGMYTNYINMASITTLSDVAERMGAEEMIYFGDCPGLTYILRIPSAMSSSWCDLDSVSIDEFNGDLKRLKATCPPVVIRQIEPSSIHYEEKHQALLQFMDEMEYDCVFENTDYLVYIVR